MSVEQPPDFLNSDTEDVGDAYDAWAALSSKLDSLPDWAREYFEKVLKQIHAFDPHTDEEIALTCHLEVPVIRSKQRKPLGAKSKHNYEEIFEWVQLRRQTEGVNLEAALTEYIEKFKLEDGYETIKSAYHKVSRVRRENLDQGRPHFTLDSLKTHLGKKP